MTVSVLYLAVLYAGLGSEDWHTREAADRAIVRLVGGRPWVYGPPLARWAGGATSPEVAARARRPCAIYARYRADAYVPRTVPVWPVCDCFPRRVFPGVDLRDRTAIPCEAWGAAPPYDPATDGGPSWHRWRRPTEAMARRLIRDGAPPADVDALLLRMWRLELAAGSDCRRRDALESWAGRPWAGGYPDPQP